VSESISLETVKEISQILANLATTLVAIAAAFWFFRSRRFSKRVEFNAEFQVYESGDPDNSILQVTLLLDNKGEVEHHCGTLAFEVVEMRPDGRAVCKPEEGFVYRSGNIVDEKTVYYYVRPGVCHGIAKEISVPSRVKLTKVSAFFIYSEKRLDIKTDEPLLDQRFQVPDWTYLERIVGLKTARDLLFASDGKSEPAVMRRRDSRNTGSPHPSSDGG
jgi:hypothetical protein